MRMGNRIYCVMQYMYMGISTQYVMVDHRPLDVCTLLIHHVCACIYHDVMYIIIIIIMSLAHWCA